MNSYVYKCSGAQIGSRVICYFIEKTVAASDLPLLKALSFLQKESPTISGNEHFVRQSVDSIKPSIYLDEEANYREV